MSAEDREAYRILLARHQAHVKAWSDRDVEALRELYHSSCLIFDAHPPAVSRSWEEFKERTASLFRELSEIRIRTFDEVARADERMDDRIGWVACRYEVVGRRDGEPYRARGRWTEIYEKSPEGWKLVHFHSSVDPAIG